MKKTLALLLATSLLSAPIYASTSQIIVHYGSKVDTVSSKIKNQVTYLGLRELGEVLNLEVAYFPTTNSATLTAKNGNIIEVNIGTGEIQSARNENKWVKLSMFVEDGSTYLPLRAVSNALDITVTYENNDNNPYILLRDGLVYDVDGTDTGPNNYGEYTSDWEINQQFVDFEECLQYMISSKLNSISYDKEDYDIIYGHYVEKYNYLSNTILKEYVIEMDEIFKQNLNENTGDVIRQIYKNVMSIYDFNYILANEFVYRILDKY